MGILLVLLAATLVGTAWADDVPILEYSGGCDVQHGCCTEEYDIGFDFPFFCTTATTVRVSVNGGVFLDGSCYSGDDAVADISILRGNLVLLNIGHIGLYHTVVAGVPVAVIEWSHVATARNKHHGLQRDREFGAMQVWLFQNGSIGLAYHFTEAAVGKITKYLINHPEDDDASNDIEQLEDYFIQGLRYNHEDYDAQDTNPLPDFLLRYQAYILTPDSSDCEQDYIVTGWRAPDTCFNTDTPYADMTISESESESMSVTESTSLSATESESESPSDSESRSLSAPTNGPSTSATLVSEIQYRRPLHVCSGPKHWPFHEANKPEGSAVGGSVVGVAVGLLLVYVFIALYV